MSAKTSKTAQNFTQMNVTYTYFQRILHLQCFIKILNLFWSLVCLDQRDKFSKDGKQERNTVINKLQVIETIFRLVNI